MSYRRVRTPAKIAYYEVVSQTTGSTIHYADDADEVLFYANEYRQSPDIMFVGIDESGYQTGIWTMADVLSGEFEAEVQADIPA